MLYVSENKWAGFIAIPLFFAISCASVPSPETIPAGLSVPELTQEAQNWYAKGNVPAAEVYYRVIMERFADNPAAVMGAEYELAHIKIKQKKWAQALSDINRLLARYDADAEFALPGSYRKLLLLDRDKIPARYRGTDEPGGGDVRERE